ncbi:LPS-assembly protein LptD [Parablastomonas sp. CN1-191]|uniref:LPS-assembly protein LptD n=1 Tax=Parablastomonas sp. CN1-191 TaxID=3400908 RepID=UPI003BF91C30
MVPRSRPRLPALSILRQRWRGGAAVLALTLSATPALAQDAAVSPTQSADPLAQPVPPTPPVVGGPAPTADADRIGFEANGVEYNSDADTITATGNVVLRREDQSVRADAITYNRKSGQIVATGNVRFVDQDGNQLFSDRVELTDELKAGGIDNLLLALREGGRLAAVRGERDANGSILLTKAAYTACAVEDGNGCPKKPSWRITAQRVVYNPQTKRVQFRNARLEVFGIGLVPLPGLTISTDGRAVSGLLVPDIRLSASNGVELSDTYYVKLSDSADLGVTGYVYTKALPMVSAQYRQLLGIGAFQVTGYATRSRRITISGAPTSQTDFRGYVFANGKLQFDPYWSLTASIRVASDRTFLRRYDISRDDRLRSMVDLERIATDSYFSLAGWATQTLRVGDTQGQVPIALPELDWRQRLADPVLGGRVELQLNTLAITRREGQDTQRAFARAQWEMRRITPWGQELTLTALARADLYHSDENFLTSTAVYRGNPGWEHRAFATAAADLKWPLIGEFLGGTQVLTPRIQLVASPEVPNLNVPNEDARAVDLEDSNLFALNRFPGYDRVEGGARVTYGLDWQLERPGLRIATTIGQSYRLTHDNSLLPSGTGLADRLSDIVGRTEVRFKDYIKVTHRFRLDKDSFTVRRNEFDAAVGTAGTYAEVGYLRLNRDITAVEDLQDREELRLAGRIEFKRFWSAFGSAVINLTDRAEDPTNTSDGFQPLRTRLGVAYEDDCLELGVTWRRDYVATGDARRGNTFQIHFALKNLGFR